VLIAHLAASTSTLTIGAGGVMLPNHSSLVVAEQFGMLEALHPGRIDLGIGRAPGTDPVTAAALRRNPAAQAAEEFPEQLRDLFAYFEGTHPRITAVPGRGYRPSVWMLGSSDYSAQVAGMLGLPFSFAHHFSPRNTVEAMRLYREHFHPSAKLERPHSMVAVAVVCAADDDRARYLAGPSRLSMARLRTGVPTRLPSPEEAAAHDYSPGEESAVGSLSGSAVIGGPDTVRTGLADLVGRTGADELMLTTMVYDPADRIRSFELVAELAGLQPLPVSSAAASASTEV
jgi:luciferase family oxidoreductase group 1